MRLPPVAKIEGAGKLFRFKGKILEADFHYVPDTSVPYDRMICPQSKCQICQSKMLEEKYSTIAWDIKDSKWVLFFSKDKFFNDVMNEVKKKGISIETMASGMGPNIAVQKNMDFAIVSEPFIEIKYKQTQPDIEECLRKLEERSIWNRYNSFESVQKDYPKAFKN